MAIDPAHLIIGVAWSFAVLVARKKKGVRR